MFSGSRSITTYKETNSEGARFDTMDSFGDNNYYAIIPFLGESTAEDDSQESTARTPSFSNGDIVKIYLPGLGEVGVGTIVEARPQGEWLGVPIPIDPWIFVLLRPSSIVSEAERSRVTPCQRGVQTLLDALNRTVLWSLADIVKQSADAGVDQSPFIRQQDWIGLEVHRLDSEGVLLSSKRITCWQTNDYFQHSTLDEDHVGVTILDIFVGNPDAIMSHAKWALSECWFPSGRCLKDTVEHFAAFPDVPDPLAYLGGREKAPYCFIVRQPSICEKETQFERKTTDFEIHKVSSAKCCDRNCSQFFPCNMSLKIR